MKINKNILLTSIIWLLLVATSLSWNYYHARQDQNELALHTARSFFQQIVISRQWNARHGGLYAPVTQTTTPNPYLNVPRRDIAVDDGLHLTMINPAFMTRQLSEIAMEKEGIQFHITSLNPIRPDNKASLREKAALQNFEQGINEVGSFITENSTPIFFYMAPLLTEKACLKCHAQQGYKEGDIRGGISVTLPFIMPFRYKSLLWGHLAIGLIGLIGIIAAGIRLTRSYDTIKRQVIFDALTGIPNRRSFSECILREFKRSRRDQAPISIILCDIDNFKDYNDTYGHTSGDICLKKVAQTIEKSLQRPGDFCARYGGEEFIIILTTTPLEGALKVAEKIRQNVVDLALTHKKSLPLQLVSLSLGVATSVDTSLISHEDLIHFADKALYDAKDKGRNRVEAFTAI
ncbi:MAG: diguanylate cyclase [Proteobacteria bacterium]|nr:diguanylate cyclase [Pseudomonadota bacterium]MBU1640475.1 diguanylate cyclase [Pseudomonadota bacterium]